ncbi:MAG: hypothetical protein ACUVQ0_01480 [Thermoproteota archaeon]
MAKLEKRSTYFYNPGPENTDDVIKAIARRLREEDIEDVVVASTSGRTGLKFTQALKKRVRVIAVSHERMVPEIKERIIRLGGLAIDGTHLPLHSRGMDKVRDAFYTLGQGFKVAVEVIMIASDKGVLKPRRDAIGVGGSGEGADTAIIARATPTRDIFSSDKSSRLEVREIIAMPVRKKWWD